MSEKIKELYKRGLFHIFAGNILNKLFSFVSSVVVVRIVSKPDYANLSYMDNLYSYVTLFAGLGMASAILKYCSSDDKRKNKAYFTFALRYGSIVQVGIILILIIYLLLADIPFSGVRRLALLYCIFPVIEYWLSVLYNLVRSMLHNKLYVKMSIVQTASVMVLGIGMVYLIGIKGLLLARYIAVIMACVLGGLFVIRQYKNEQADRLNRQEIKAFMSMAISLLIANLFSMVMPLNETFLINNLIRDEVISANYKVAVMLPAQLTFITSSLMVYYFPIIARMRDKGEVWKLSVKIGKATGAVVLAVAGIGLLLSGFIISLLYGEKYLDAVEMSRVFWIVYALNAGFRMIPMNILPALGYAKFNAIAAAVSCVIHLGVDYLMILALGISGVAVATSAVYLLSGIAYWIYMYKVCHVNKEREAI